MFLKIKTTASKVIHKASLPLRELLGETLLGEARRTFSIRFHKLPAPEGPGSCFMMYLPCGNTGLEGAV